MLTPLVLGLLAVVLAGPAPAVLMRLPLLRRTPRAAMVLWQSVALAAVLAAVGAGLSLATDRAWRHPDDAGALVIGALALAVTGIVVVRLLLSGHLIGTRLRALRRRHLAQVELLAARDLDRDGASSLRVLAHEVPLAYCVPDGRPGRSRVVVTAGVLGRLAPGEVDAVLAHERAHLRARHDLVLEAFSVLHAAFPRWVSSAAALSEVRLLVEVLADRAAVRGRGSRARRDLAAALVGIAEARAGGPALAEGVVLGLADVDLLARVRLLADRREHRLQAALTLLAAVALLLLPTLAVVLPWARDLA